MSYRHNFLVFFFVRGMALSGELSCMQTGLIKKMVQ